MAKEPLQHGKRTQCKPHVTRRRHKPRENRTSARQRGYTAEWERFRKSFLIANPLCEYCKARGHITAAVICDHDLPHDHDPHLFWDNTFTALCKWDHDSTKQRMERRYSGEALLKAIVKAKA